MQVMEVSAMEILTSKLRMPDHNNPRGYYEYGKVKSLQTDSSWVVQAEGKACKNNCSIITLFTDTFGVFHNIYET